MAKHGAPTEAHRLADNQPAQGHPASHTTQYLPFLPSISSETWEAMSNDRKEPRKINFEQEDTTEEEMLHVY